MALTNTQRSRNLLRQRGYLVDTVEHWNHHAKVRQDMFGFVDLVAVRKGEMLLVQTTAWSAMATRLHKIAAAPAALWCLTVPGVRIVIHGWKKNGRAWEVKEREVEPCDL